MSGFKVKPIFRFYRWITRYIRRMKVLPSRPRGFCPLHPKTVHLCLIRMLEMQQPDIRLLQRPLQSIHIKTPRVWIPQSGADTNVYIVRL